MLVPPGHPPGAVAGFREEPAFGGGASRLGNNTPRQTGVATGFRHTPRGYRAGPATFVPNRSSDGPGGLAIPRRCACRMPARRTSRCPTRASRARDGARPLPRLTPPSGAPYHPRRRTRAVALLGARRVCVPLGVGVSGSQGSMERITDSPDGQADVSPEEAPPRKGARVPRPHEDAGRPPRAGSASRQGPAQAQRLTGERSHNSLRLVMLSRPADFARLAEGGVGRSHPLLVGRFVRNDLDQTRFAMATGKRLGGAVVRNRVRRRIREVLRAMAPSFQPGWDVLIIARSAIVDADHDALVGALERVLRSGGVLRGTTQR